MNVFRLMGDGSHLFAIILLLVKIWSSDSCSGISGKSQIIYLTVFVTRYMDIFTNFVSIYNSLMKVFFILSTALTIFLIRVRFKSTYDAKGDSFRLYLLFISAFGLAIFINHEWSVMEILWTFSIYLESVAIVPQLHMVYYTGDVDVINNYYLYALGSYRGFYIFNWIYRYNYEGFYDTIAIVAGVVQTLLYIVFFILFTLAQSRRQKKGLARAVQNLCKEFEDSKPLMTTVDIDDDDDEVENLEDKLSI